MLSRQNKASSRLSPVLIFACLIIIAVATGYSFWFWHQQSRPGRMYELKGADAAAAGHFHAAEREWKAGIQHDPSYAGCYQRLGDLYLAVHDYADAVTYYQQAVHIRPNDGLLFKNLATAQMSEGDNNGALPNAKRAYDLLPYNADAASTYGFLADDNSQPGNAYQALERAHTLSPDNWHVVLKLASVEMDLMNMGQAEQDLAIYLKKYPNDALACYLMAVIYNQKPRTAANVRTAAAYAERSLDTGEAPDNLYPLLAQLELSMGKVATAQTVCLAGLKHQPNNQSLLSILINCDTRQGQIQQAAQLSTQLQTLTLRENQIDHLKHVMGFDPANISAGLQLALLEQQVSNLSDAEKDYVLLIRQAPQNIAVRRAAAAFLRRTGRPHLARQIMNMHFVP